MPVSSVKPMRGMMSEKMPESPSTMHMNLKKHKMPESHMKMGAMMNMMVKAKVTSIRKDEFGETMGMEIMSMKHMEGGHDAEEKEEKS